MKLRNKKTGEICELGHIRQAWREEKDGGMGYMFLKSGDNKGIIYNSLAEINEEWEDYTRPEPLIKDEKMRKAVRAWAEATGTKSVSYWGHLESCQNDASIDLQNRIGLKNGDDYTIAELCGTPEPLEPTFIDLDEQTKEKEEK